MQYIYESKYNPGDTVYQVRRWVRGTLVRKRKVVGIAGLVPRDGGLVIEYQLEPLDSSPYAKFDTKVPETRLFTTREEAQAEADRLAAGYIQRQREMIEKQLHYLETRREDEIYEATQRINKDFTEEREHLEARLRELLREAGV